MRFSRFNGMSFEQLYAVLTVFVFASMASAASITPAYLKSTVPGLPTINAHILSMDDDGKPVVIRGHAPATQEFKNLKAIGVTDILMFKNELKDENQQETAALKSLGYDESHIIEVPMPWKNLPDFKSSCQLALEALNDVIVVKNAGGSIFFHCTVGEDRTGFLAGLYRVAVDKESKDDAFFNEMCARGYEAGNPNKPVSSVVMPIRAGLTPLFLIMADRIAKYGVDPKICDLPPEQISGSDKKHFICK